VTQITVIASGVLRTPGQREAGARNVCADYDEWRARLDAAGGRILSESSAFVSADGGHQLVMIVHWECSQPGMVGESARGVLLRE
jgi:hypothetical protein